MQFDNDVAFGTASEPSIEHLSLAGVEVVNPWRFWQAVEDLARVNGLGLALSFAQLLEIDHQQHLYAAYPWLTEGAEILTLMHSRLKSLTHPTRFELVTSAFGGSRSCP